jgi:hypothetical protein
MNEPQSAPEPEPAVRPFALGQVALAILAGAARLIPHPWNFSPSYAVEVFAGARLRAWQALTLALAIRVLVDVCIYIFPFGSQRPYTSDYWADMPWVYVSVLLNVLLGRLLRRTESPWRVGGVTLLASLQFYLMTNFGSWIALYPHTPTGLVECYIAGLPFFGPTLLSYVIFVPVLFGAHALLVRTAFWRERVAA